MIIRKWLTVLTILFSLVNIGCDRQIQDPVVTVPAYKKHDDLKHELLTVAVPSFNPSDAGYIDSIVEELNKMTVDKINTNIRFVYLSRSMLSYDIHLQLNSGNSDITYCNNGALGLSSDGSMPYLVSQGLVKDITDMLSEYAPDINNLFHNVNYMDFMKINERIYGIPLSMPLTSMPVAVIRKDLIKDHENINIGTMDDVYTLLVNSDLRGEKYGFYSNLGCNPGNAIPFFANVNDYLTIPFQQQSGYLYDHKKNQIARFEDTHILENMRDFYHYYGLYGVNSYYSQAINDTNIGIIVTNAYNCMMNSTISNEFEYYLLYKEKKFESFHYVPMVVISASSDKSERALIFLNYLFSDMNANILVSHGLENQNYQIRSGVCIDIKPVSLMGIYNPQHILPAWPDTLSFQRVFDDYLDSVYIQDNLLTLYNDYELLKKYKSIIESKEEYGLKGREEIINQYTAANNKEEKNEAFYGMLHTLEKTTDFSIELQAFSESIINGIASSKYVD